MSDFWDFYQTIVDDEQAFIRIDLGVADEKNPRDYPYCIGVCVSFSSMNSAGMPTQSESEAMSELEDAIWAFLQTELDAVPVAVVTMPKHRDFIFYSPRNAAQTRDRISEFVTSRSHRVCETFAHEDAEWKFYFETLYPEPEDALWMQDHHLVEELISEGDEVECERVVDHFAMFRSKQQRDKFIGHVIPLGYTVAELTDDDSGDTETPYEVHLTRSHPVALNAVQPITNELAKLVWQFEGEYDGWGCMPVLRQSARKKGKSPRG